MLIRPLALAALVLLPLASAAGQERNIHYQLLVAAREGNPAQVRTLLDAGAEPDSRDRNGDTPLNHVARKGDVELARLLLDRGASPDLANLSKVTPLMSAAYSGNAEIVRLLLGRGAEPGASDQLEPWSMRREPVTRSAWERCSMVGWTSMRGTGTSSPP